MGQEIINFGTGILAATATTDYLGNALANPTPVAFGNLQEIDLEFSFDEKKLYGAGQFPIAVGRGMGTIALSGKNASINAQAYGSLFFGRGLTAGIRQLAQNVPGTVPAATTYTITATPPATGTWTADLGVFYAATGIQLTPVASAPTAGQYTVSGSGLYTFAAADASASLLMNYEYTATSTSASYLTLTNTNMGLAPFFSAVLQTQYGGGIITAHLNRLMATKFTFPHKNDDFSIPDFDASAFADAAGIIGYLAFNK